MLVVRLETILDGQDLLGESPAAVTGISRSGARRIAGRGALQPSGDSSFRIASLTKTFTSAAVVLALRAHHVALNTPAIDLLPSLGADWHADRTVTVEQLLGQVSGLRESMDATTMATLGDGPEAVLEGARLAVRAGNERPPSTRWSYYNGNYFLAGAILASVCGTTYEAALAQCVLTPWGLSRTSFESPATPIPGSDGTTPLPVADYPRSRRPSGGLWSCVDDLLALGEHLLADADLCGETRRPRTAPLDPMTYGLGWALGPTGQMYLNGRLPGYRAAMLLLPGYDYISVMLTNQQTALPVAARVLSDLQRPLTGDDLSAAINAFAD